MFFNKNLVCLVPTTHNNNNNNIVEEHICNTHWTQEKGIKVALYCFKNTKERKEKEREEFGVTIISMLSNQTQHLTTTSVWCLTFSKFKIKLPRSFQNPNTEKATTTLSLSLFFFFFKKKKLTVGPDQCNWIPVKKGLGKVRIYEGKKSSCLCGNFLVRKKWVNGFAYLTRGSNFQLSVTNSNHFLHF